MVGYCLRCTFNCDPEHHLGCLHQQVGRVACPGGVGGGGTVCSGLPLNSLDLFFLIMPIFVI